jgi:hypothetical protein
MQKLIKNIIELLKPELIDSKDRIPYSKDMIDGITSELEQLIIDFVRRGEWEGK